MVGKEAIRPVRRFRWRPVGGLWTRQPSAGFVLPSSIRQAATDLQVAAAADFDDLEAKLGRND